MAPKRMSMAIPFERRFFSLKKRAPQMKVMITELRRSIDTTESIEPGLLRDRKYRKSDAVMKMAMSQTAQSWR